MAQRREPAGARRVVFEEEAIDGEPGEEPRRDIVIAAAALAVAGIAAAEMDADRHVRGVAADRIVDRRDIIVDELIRILAAPSHESRFFASHSTAIATSSIWR